MILLAMTAPPSRQAVGEWWDRTQPGKGQKAPQSKYYNVRSDLAVPETQTWARHLDTMYEEYTRRLVMGGGLRRRTPEVLNVFLFARRQDYLDTMRTQFGLNATGSGGMFFMTPRGGGLAFYTENLPQQRIAHVAQHEGFHQFAHAFFGNDLPPWLNEGLAEFFGHSIVDGKSIVIGQAPPQVLELMRQSVKENKYIPFNDLLQMDEGRWNGAVRMGTAAQQYEQSWSMVHFLVYGNAGKYQPAFQQMLRMVNGGTRSYQAMRTAFGLATDTDIRDFEAKWIEHIQKANPSTFIAARVRLEFLAEGLKAAWQKGQRPATLQELRKTLMDEQFKYPMTAHGYTLTLNASDDSNYAVPLDATNKSPVALELIAAAVPRTAAAKKLEEQHPTPPTIRTRGMEPKDVVVQWKRRSDSPAEFDYEMVSPK
jgi:hypothetical protein